MTTNVQRISDAEYAAALAAGRIEAETEIRAQAVHRDIQISVHGLLTAILPAMLPSRSIAAIFASRGGQATSREKRKSSRTNGRKGGRPRKRSSTETV
jgi:hypothetical protein